MTMFPRKDRKTQFPYSEEFSENTRLFALSLDVSKWREVFLEFELLNVNYGTHIIDEKNVVWCEWVYQLGEQQMKIKVEDHQKFLEGFQMLNFYLNGELIWVNKLVLALLEALPSNSFYHRQLKKGDEPEELTEVVHLFKNFILTAATKKIINGFREKISFSELRCTYLHRSEYITEISWDVTMKTAETEKSFCLGHWDHQLYLFSDRNNTPLSEEYLIEPLKKVVSDQVNIEIFEKNQNAFLLQYALVQFVREEYLKTKEYKLKTSFDTETMVF